MPVFSDEYPIKNTPVDDDKVLIADSENANAIKGSKISAIIAKAVNAVKALTDWITTAMIKDGAVTSDKIDFKSLPAFCVGMSTTQSIAASTFAALNLDTKEYDTGNNFNATSHTFKVPVDGLYHIDMVAGNEAGTKRAVYVYNATTSAYLAQSVNGAADPSLSCDLWLKKDEIIEFRTWANADIVINNSLTKINGRLVALMPIST